MTLERFLYEDLTYTINTGKSPVVVNSSKVHNKISVPFVNWEINLGMIDYEFKNFIEESLMSADEVKFITSICPAYRIVKNNSQYFYIYKHELDFYGSNFVDLRRVVPASISSIDNFKDAPNKVLKNFIAYEHTTLFLQDALQVIHKANGLMECRINLKEYFKPTSLSYELIGSSYASDSVNCK